MRNFTFNIDDYHKKGQVKLSQEILEADPERITVIANEEFDYEKTWSNLKALTLACPVDVRSTGVHNFCDLLRLNNKIDNLNLIIVFDVYSKERIHKTYGEYVCYLTQQSLLVSLGKQQFCIEFLITPENIPYILDKKSFIKELKQSGHEVTYSFSNGIFTPSMQNDLRKIVSYF